MRIGWIVAESLQLRFFRKNEAAPGIFADVPRWRAGHTRGHSIAPVQRLSGDGVPETFQKDPKRYLHWGYLDISGHGKHMETFQKLLTSVRPSPELMQEFRGFHTLCMACGADHFSAFCQVISSVSTHVVQECSGQSRTKMIKMSSFKFLRSSTAWTSWKTNGRKHPWPLGRRRPKVYHGLPKSPGSETTSSWKSPAGISDDQAKQLGIDDVDIDDLGGQGQMCPAHYQKLPKGRWWSDDDQIITVWLSVTQCDSVWLSVTQCDSVWLSVTDECRADANSVILRQFCASHFSAHVDVRMSENEAFLKPSSRTIRAWLKSMKKAQPNKPDQPHQSRAPELLS